MRVPLLCLVAILPTIGSVVSAAAPSGPSPKVPFPRVQVIPQPDDQASFQVEGVEKFRYHWPSRYIRPYWFPLIGPEGVSVTRFTHPHDPNGHSHHNAVWIAHNNVNGWDFWSDRTPARIVQDRILRYGDGVDSASMVVRNYWLNGARKRIMQEIRTARLRPLDRGELLVDIEMEFSATTGSVTFGKTPFGFLGIRVAKTMGVNDGGGEIRNSEGAIGEKDILWKRARWVDYSGAITPTAENGIALMDHPSNPRYPTFFHVRGDGWMGTAFCCEEPYVLPSRQTLKLRHRLYVHRDRTPLKAIEREWKRFAGE